MSSRPSLRRPAFALVVSLLAAGCTPADTGTVGNPDAKGPQADASAPLVKGGIEQPPVKVKGKTVSAREAAGVGR
ncbi:hypothetical protein [Paludisphaera mucosa]|uniref:Uncharacterized protein n=1 Tax=Paludisphaera mucosa TaxID=3030827 RepID=A0ABT6FGL1_9BACT|nr:hypothetical protein [Paludisphaera mucosa]MDG3006712.1 hypothetical protein [Paludisphaera mucosa]